MLQTIPLYTHLQRLPFPYSPFPALPLPQESMKKKLKGMGGERRAKREGKRRGSSEGPITYANIEKVGRGRDGGSERGARMAGRQTGRRAGRRTAEVQSPVIAN